MRLNTQQKADVIQRNGRVLSRLGVQLANDRPVLCWLYSEKRGMYSPLLGRPAK